MAASGEEAVRSKLAHTIKDHWIYRPRHDAGAGADKYKQKHDHRNVRNRDQHGNRGVGDALDGGHARRA